MLDIFKAIPLVIQRKGNVFCHKKGGAVLVGDDTDKAFFKSQGHKPAWRWGHKNLVCFLIGFAKIAKAGS